MVVVTPMMTAMMPVVEIEIVMMTTMVMTSMMFDDQSDVFWRRRG
jgi:hypothetical protein